MIISASRRTDIPAHYSDWFFHRLREGYALVRNPVNVHALRHVDLTPEGVDGIVFWTKNPGPMLDRLPLLKDYAYVFQFTLTPYGPEAEPGIPPKEEFIVPAFYRLSDMIGPDRVFWRYDPVLISREYTVSYHMERFGHFAELLRGRTRQCVISFVDMYRGMRKNAERLGLAEPPARDKARLAGFFAGVARDCGFGICACAEDTDFSACGVGRSRCVDARLIERLSGRHAAVKKDRNQRPACLCHESVDIGAYNTCKSGCLYCYARTGAARTASNLMGHDPSSPLMIGRLEEGRRHETACEDLINGKRAAKNCGGG